MPRVRRQRGKWAWIEDASATEVLLGEMCLRRLLAGEAAGDRRSSAPHSSRLVMGTISRLSSKEFVRTVPE